MKIGILGAGSIGCHVGGMLAASGSAPVLVGRAAMGARLSHGIELTGRDGRRALAAPGSFHFAEDPAALGGCEVILVCVKSEATRRSGELLASVVQPEATVVSLQNGVSNANLIRQCLPGRPVLAGVVGFNVAQIGASRFHRGTEGDLVIEAGGAGESLVRLLLAAGLPAHASDDIRAVQWGKLIQNLNNAVNALSGLPLKRQLSIRPYRQVLAATIREARTVLAAAGISPARIGRVGPALLAPVLELPDWLFVRLAAGMLRIDAEARSSMADDLERGRVSEIDWLNGEISALGRRYGIATPANDRIIELVKAAFAAEAPRSYSGEALRRAVLSPRA
ncbi:ketopantoate reductase [Hoeflea marina]|uniref:2-dehydropantoate 2-reductase n=1 Tax=Hoeflea marina TaxID=274592 RepID=A0A317PGD8_9HYPH|nr:2-dehydropantoate 2-reductase [Hoeflea marina]PWV99271.1 ketopantoate reductase [Hoeflea marina]